jgi:hypothetical protein
VIVGVEEGGREDAAGKDAFKLFFIFVVQPNRV